MVKFTGSFIILALAMAAESTSDFAAPCYSSVLPQQTQSTKNRTLPWSSPSFNLLNGTTCCTSLTEVRAGIDTIDSQLLQLLAQRAAYVREATRFKATLDSVNVPSRNEEVIQNAVNQSNSTSPPLPAVVAKGVFEAILNSSMPFEECVFEEFRELC